MGVNLRYLGHAMMHTNDQGVFEVLSLFLSFSFSFFSLFFKKGDDG